MPCTPEGPPYSPILCSTPLAATTPPTPIQVSLDGQDSLLGYHNEVVSPTCNFSWCGYKLVGDNIDKNIHPRHETLDHRTQSLHYFNCYAVKDRCDLGSFSDLKPFPNFSQVDLTQLLPQKIDLDDILKNMVVLASRILTEHVCQFQKYTHLVPTHIGHQHSKEMSTKSAVVSLNRCVECALKAFL